MSAAKTLTANYQLQYQLTHATNPAAVGTTNLPGLAAGGWYDSGATATITATQDVAKVGSARCGFRIWTGVVGASTLTKNIMMSAAKTLTANYQLQYQLYLYNYPA